MTADTKSALLDAAEKVARARGFDGFSYADLSEAVGIRKASIHYHFPTKGQLSVRLMERYSDRLSQERADITKREVTGAGRLLSLINVYRAALSEGHAVCLCVSLTVSRESLGDDVMAQVNSFRAETVEWLQAVFALGEADGSIDAVKGPQDEARAALALLEGAHLAARASVSIAVFDDAVRLLALRCKPQRAS